MSNEILKETGALLEGHFKLSSGLHSNKYIQCAKITQQKEGLHHIEVELLRIFRKWPVIYSPNVVIGGAYGGIIFSHIVADVLRSATRLAHKTRSVFCERVPEVSQDINIAHMLERESGILKLEYKNGRVSFPGPVDSKEHHEMEVIFNKTVLNNHSVKSGNFQLRRGFEINKGERVLIAEDVTTTGKSVGEVAALVDSLGGIVVGVISIIDRRSTKEDHLHVDIPVETGEHRDQIIDNYHALFEMDVETWKEDDCPLCKEGFPIEKPGSRK